jgi:nicotinate (nicotinamide) nucleotide adenylyltransferase
MTHRIGIYPGTFDPIHQGHLAFCLEVIRRGLADEVILLPEHSPRNKPYATVLSQRFIQLNEALGSFPLLWVERVGSKQFSVAETLPELERIFSGSTLCLLVGSDIIPSLHTWNDLDMLLARVSLVVGMRHLDQAADVEQAIEQIGQAYSRSIDYSLINTSHADVTSSRIRTGELLADFSML